MRRVRARRLWALLISVAVAAALFLVPVGAGAAGHLTPIYDIQAAGHISPFLGVEVTTQGVVTAVDSNGYYIQDPVGDGNDATSDGMFVFTGGAPGVAVGDLLEVKDSIGENFFGSDLSSTQMAFPSMTTIISSGNPLPEPVVIGKKGRIPPDVLVISPTDEPVDLRFTNPLSFDPTVDGIDFYESLEGMRVTIDDPVAVSATRTFGATTGELFTLASKGKFIAPKDARTKRGGIELQPDPDNLGDQNPERVQIQFDSTLFPFPIPAIPVDSKLDDVTGVMGYSFGNFEVVATEEFDWKVSKNKGEVSKLKPKKKELTVASYNVLNVTAAPADGDGPQIALLGSQIVNNLRSPDVIALQEIQDDSGVADNGVTDATLTLTALRDAVVAAGGPTYSFFDVAPANNTQGGVPGGNIRNAFFYNADRVDLVGFVSLDPAALTAAGVSDPAAFAGTRNPLAGTFDFNGHEFTVVNNHLTSRFGSTPIFGGPQPFVQAGEAAREAQTGALNEYTDYLLGLDADANVIVLGDLNTFQWTNDLEEILPGVGPDQVLTNLIPSKLKGSDKDNVYTFNFEGNSQALDHFFVTDGLLGDAKQLDIVHVNVDFPRVDPSVGSDHEPLLASFKLK